MIFLFEEKNNVSFSRYLDFCVFVKCTDFKICGVIISIDTLNLGLFLLNPRRYENEFWSNTSVLYDKHL